MEDYKGLALTFGSQAPATNCARIGILHKHLLQRDGLLKALK